MESILQNVDKSSWTCLKFDDGSVYYGELHTFDDHGVLNDKIEDGKKMRHGYGVQIFLNEDKELHCKYEGTWDKDKKHGEGMILYPDKSVYKGNFIYDLREGMGKYAWHSGETYDGGWKRNRMEGNGIFTTSSGKMFQGVFKNNYFKYSETIFVNPLHTNEDLAHVIKYKDEVEKIKEAQKVKSLQYLQKTDSFGVMFELLTKSKANYRVPVILSTRGKYLSKEELFQNLLAIGNIKLREFDLRGAYLAKINNTFKNFMAETKEALAESLALGGGFVVNIDDTSLAYEEVFDPNIKEMYNESTLPQYIFSPKELSIPEVHKRVLANTKYAETKVKENPLIIIWSKYKLDDNIDENKLQKKIERRFSLILPIHKLDFIVMM